MPPQLAFSVATVLEVTRYIPQSDVCPESAVVTLQASFENVTA